MTEETTEVVPVPTELLNLTLEYVQTRPWREVRFLMDKWMLFQQNFEKNIKQE